MEPNACPDPVVLAALLTLTAASTAFAQLTITREKDGPRSAAITTL